MSLMHLSEPVGVLGVVVAIGQTVQLYLFQGGKDSSPQVVVVDVVQLKTHPHPVVSHLYFDPVDVLVQQFVPTLLVAFDCVATPQRQHLQLLPECRLSVIRSPETQIYLFQFLIALFEVKAKLV